MKRADPSRLAMQVRSMQRDAYSPAELCFRWVVIGLTAAALMTASWGAVTAGPLQLVDDFLAAALGLLLLARLTGWIELRLTDLPYWMLFPVVGLTVVVTSHLLDPVPSGYLSQRLIVPPTLSAFTGQFADVGNVEISSKWLVALLLLPVIVAVTASLDRRAFGWLISAWVFGVVASCAVALLDDLQLTAISSSLLPIVDVGGRQAGLTTQPNNLAVAAVTAIPVAMTLRLPRFSTPVVTLILVLLVSGVLVSGSRGGAAAAVLALVLGLVFISDYRRRIALPLLAGILIAGPLLFLYAETVLDAAGGAVRLTGESSAGESDVGRAALIQQGFTDLRDFPVTGVGMQAITQAHSAPLQLLAAGGLVLFVTMSLFMVCAVVTAVRINSPVSRALGISVLTFMALGIVENQLTDRYLYIAVAMIGALFALDRASRSVPTTPRAASWADR